MASRKTDITGNQVEEIPQAMFGRPAPQDSTLRIAPSGLRYRSAALALSAAAMGLVVLSGCGRNRYTIEPDPRFSLNVLRTPTWFPHPKMELTPAESELIYRRGKPDLLRFWWNDEGSLITSSDLSGKQKEDVTDLFGRVKISWIYLDDNEEALLLANGSGYRIQPIDEKLRLICRHGDPTTKSPPSPRGGSWYETWTWIDEGLQVEFKDGHENKTTYLPPTGSGTIILK